MYVRYWNLREEPFLNVADLRFAYLAEQHEEGLARLVYLVKNRKTGGILTGPYGAGKSMILEMLAREIRGANQSKYLGISMMPGETISLARRILKFMEYDVQLSDVTRALEALQDAMRNPKTGFSHIVLAIDEAQLIGEKATWQFLHLLTNIAASSQNETPPCPAFTLILCGHTGLVNHLQSYPALSQRMQLAWKLNPLTGNQTMEYIQHRMRSAGGDIWVFADDAMREIHRASNGLPRVINNICDTALMLGCAGKLQRITKEIAEQAAADTQFVPLADDAEKTGGKNNG